ncbi:MAG: DUF438 domain-containing protein [Anaerolineae bacterium]
MGEYIRNKEQRQETLKGVIKRLHRGEPVEAVKADFAQLLRDVGPSEIAEIEQALIAEGLPEAEVKRLCDVHVAVFRESLDRQAPPQERPGHPIHTFRAENDAAEAVLGELERAIAELEQEPDDPAHWKRVATLLSILREYDKHYLRKENLLFPYLEKQGFAGPSSVMWAIHDDVRDEWKSLEPLLESGPGEDAVEVVAQIRNQYTWLAQTIRDMFYKEANILFPTALEKLSEDEWREIRAQEAEIGYSYVEPEDWPVGGQAAGGELAPESVSWAGQLPLDTGALMLEQINLLFGNLPLDITYVDVNDEVRFFSHGQERVFPRSPAVIGRKVQKCHPPQSVYRVQQILDAFRAGTRDVAEFWIQMHGRFVHIRYFALRDGGGSYQGTLEVVQDITALRELQGERRLVDWEG